MERFQIKYRNKLSQVTRHTTFALGEEDLCATLVDLVNDGNFVDWIGFRDEKDNIGYFHELHWKRKCDLFEELNIKDKNFKNMCEAYDEWERR